MSTKKVNSINTIEYCTSRNGCYRESAETKFDIEFESSKK